MCLRREDDNEDDTSCQMAARCPAKKSPKQNQKTLWNVPSTDVIAVTRKNRKNSQKKQKLTGSSPQTHEVSALVAQGLCLWPTCGALFRCFTEQWRAPDALRDGATASRDPYISECEWPILELTRMRGATLSTPTELKSKTTTNSV